MNLTKKISSVAAGLLLGTALLSSSALAETLSLQKSWNFVSSPYNGDMDLTKLTAANCSVNVYDDASKWFLPKTTGTAIAGQAVVAKCDAATTVEITGTTNTTSFSMSSKISSVGKGAIPSTSAAYPLGNQYAVVGTPVATTIGAVISAGASNVLYWDGTKYNTGTSATSTTVLPAGSSFYIQLKSATTTATKTVAVSGDITTDTTWSADTVYTLDGKVKVKNGAKLTIEAGTKIIGKSTAYLVITKGSKIEAVGTADKPIIFDSEDHYFGAAAAAGQWGGVTLLGGAQTNTANLKYEVDEADADFAFGSITTEGNTESSGTLKFVEIQNSGYAVAEDKEVNGLSFAGVGSGTTVENIKIFNSGDDGIELWGGTVNLTNISIVGALDDSFDVDNGYVGTVKNLFTVQTGAGAGGMEMTNGGDSNIVRTNPTFENFVIVTASTQKKEGGLYFKDDGTTATFKSGFVVHNGKDGTLHSKVALAVAPIFENVTLTGTSTSLYTGPAAAMLQAAQETNTTTATKTVAVSGDITTDTTWSADTVYTLDGKVKVKNGAKLTIEAGTKIIGKSTAYLVITKGSKIEAVGTADKPIIFDSEDHYFGAAAAAGQWGGVTLLGGAQTNTANLKYEVDEADADFAFGSITTEGNTESSGTLKFVEIQNSGYAVAEDKEVNGLSFAGVGSGTTVENIKIFNSGDDGIELWGGTVNLTNISIVGALDDSFDVDNGYVGTVKNLFTVQTGAGAGGMEMTNGGDSNIVRTNPTFENFVIVTASTQKKEGGLYFKDDGTTATFKSGFVVHNGKDGTLHSKIALAVSPVLKNVILTGTSTSLYTGPAAATLQAAEEAK